MNPATKKKLAVLRAAFGITLVAVLLHRLEPQKLFSVLADLRFGHLALACLCQAVAKVLWTMRWKDILAACGMERRFPELLSWLFIGLFFNNFLPTAVGGDLVRGYYAAKDGGMSTSFLVLLAERVLGLITLAAMAAIAALMVLTTGARMIPEQLLLLIAATGAVFTLIGFFLFSWQGLAGRLGKIPTFGRHKIARTLDELGQALELFHRPATPKLRIVASSLALQITAVLFYIASARAVGLDTPASFFFFIVPASVIAAMLPVSLNGLGLREGTLIGLLTAQGASTSTSGAFAFLALAVSTFFSLIGGVVYLCYRNPMVRQNVTTHTS